LGFDDPDPGSDNASEVGEMENRSIRVAAAILSMCLAISGCGGSDSPSSAGLQDVPGAAEVTRPPVAGAPASMTLGGTPLATLVVGQAYSFQPTASAGINRVTYSIVGKPAWAVFNTASGLLSGTPTSADIGNYSGIAIGGNDGVSSATLPVFAINVVQTATGSATLAWIPPTANEDGTALTNLAGYKIYFGADPNALVQSVQITNPGLTTYVVANLGAGTTYFTMTSYNTSGVESARTQVGSKTI
jgi:hypothetical protein